MKIGILTFPNSTSYGAVLQMYALYHTLIDMGFEAEIINYHNEWMKAYRHTTAMQNSTPFVGCLRKCVRYLLHWRLFRTFKCFESKMLKYPSSPFSNFSKYPEIGSRYNVVICGSDQVWNPDITNEDLSYFLDFCDPCTKRVSYAPSFGVEDLDETYGKKVGKNLCKFSHLSVREEIGQKIIKKYSGKDSLLVMDPTFLLEKQEWEKRETPHSSAKREYILYYTIRSSESLWDFCKKLAQEKQLKILRIGSNVIGRYIKRDDMVEYLCDVSPEEWLYLVHHAQYVVTNSFHGTAFSIIFRKNFFVEFSSLTNSRLSQIVEMLGLEKSVVEQNKQCFLDTDYSHADKVLPVLKAESLDYLKHALTEDSELYED